MDSTIPIPIPTPPVPEAVDQPKREQPLILVADDDNNLREVVSMKLKSAGFTVETAKSGEEALAKAPQLKPDLMILDILMPPGPTGVEVALQIKAAPETKDVKLIFFSGQDDPWPAFSGDRSSVAKELGVEEFIPKTDDLDIMLQKVRHVLGIV